MAPHVLCGAIPDIPVDEVKQFCTDLFVFFPVLSISVEERLTIFTFLSRVNRILGEKGSKKTKPFLFTNQKLLQWFVLL